MIESELARWLIATKPSTLSGVRRSSLEAFQTLIGGRVFLHRAPDRLADYTLTIQRIATIRQGLLSAEQKCVQTTLQLDIFGKSLRAVEETQSLQENLRLSIASFNGFMGETWVDDVAQTSESVFSNIAADGSAEWEVISSADYSITYRDVTNG